MEHFENPFHCSEVMSARVMENRQFFSDMLARARSHRFYSHPFVSPVDDATPSREFVSFVLTSMYKLVEPFTGLLCSLGGRAPSLRARFALMDNIYEEMGRGDLSSAHPSLYLRMLASIGVPQEAADASPALPAIRRINEHLRAVVERRPFAVACALLASAEAVIPAMFPVLADMARKAFHDIDMAFFDRHGPRDDGHSDDAAMLFAVSGERAHFAPAEAALLLDLDHRSDLFDAWMSRRPSGLLGAVHRPAQTAEAGT